MKKWQVTIFDRATKEYRGVVSCQGLPAVFYDRDHAEQLAKFYNEEGEDK